MNCFHFSVLMNHAAINIHIQVLGGYMFSLLWDTYLEVELLCPMVSPGYLFKKLPICFVAHTWRWTGLCVGLFVSVWVKGMTQAEGKKVKW